MKRLAYLFAAAVLVAAHVSAAQAEDHIVPRSMSGGSGSTDRTVISNKDDTSKKPSEDKTARAQLTSKKDKSEKKVLIVRRGVSGGSAMTDQTRIEQPAGS